MSKDKHRGRARILGLLRWADENDAWGGVPCDREGCLPSRLPEIIEAVGKGLLERWRQPRGGSARTTRLRLTAAGRSFLAAHRQEAAHGRPSLGGFRWRALARQRGRPEAIRCRLCGRGGLRNGFIMAEGIGPTHAACVVAYDRKGAAEAAPAAEEA